VAIFIDARAAPCRGSGLEGLAGARHVPQ